MVTSAATFPTRCSGGVHDFNGGGVGSGDGCTGGCGVGGGGEECTSLADESLNSDNSRDWFSDSSAAPNSSSAASDSSSADSDSSADSGSAS